MDTLNSVDKCPRGLGPQELQTDAVSAPRCRMVGVNWDGLGHIVMYLDLPGVTLSPDQFLLL